MNGIGPLTFAVVGLTLTLSSVMACAVPTSGDADRLAAAYSEALGADGWHENEFTREFWYLNLVHFADAIQAPQRLISWVGDRRDRELATVVVGEVQLSQWRFGGSGMLPRPLAVARLS